MHSRITTVAAAALCCALIFACGGGGESEADDTAREITNDQLAQMVLELADFGPEYGSFAPVEGNGPQTLEDRVEEDIEPEEEREDLAKFGWASGFDQNFFSAEAVQQPSATFLVGSGVDLFGSGDNAADYYKDNRSESEDLVGKSDDDLAITRLDAFAVDASDDGFGLVMSGVSDDNRSFWLVLAVIRHGRLIGEVGFGGVGDLPAANQQGLIEKSRSLAGMLTGRIDSVLSATAPPAAAQ